MIRRDKQEGWLQLQPEAFVAWTSLNSVSFGRVAPGNVDSRGGALLATEVLDADHDQSSVLLTVPRDLILSIERVQEHAKVDRDYRELLESLGDFGRTPRGAILSFLLAQASLSCPDLSHRIGVHTPFSDYIKSLPTEQYLPTFWTPSELALLPATTLNSAMGAKLASLRREFDLLCTSCANTRWYQNVKLSLTLDDWYQVDAMYRSRALDFPDVGHCMVPCIDLANHAAGQDTVAIYEKSPDGDAVLILRDGKRVSDGGEITITYGDDKGACEMLFSYGFLDDSMETARTLFLQLNIPDNDPMKMGKAKIGDCAPGFKITETDGGEFDWTGDYVWLLCINEDDGLRFQYARIINGEEELQATLGDVEITDGAAQLHTLLTRSAMWDVYRLRAVAIMQQRVFVQLQEMFSAQERLVAVPHGEGTEIRTRVFKDAMELRRLEFEFLERAYEWFEREKLELADSPVVVRYLKDVNEQNDAEQEGDGISGDDFS